MPFPDKIVKRALARAGYRCQRKGCGATEDLQVHSASGGHEARVRVRTEDGRIIEMLKVTDIAPALGQYKGRLLPLNVNPLGEEAYDDAVVFCGRCHGDVGWVARKITQQIAEEAGLPFEGQLPLPSVLARVTRFFMEEEVEPITSYIHL